MAQQRFGVIRISGLRKCGAAGGAECGSSWRVSCSWPRSSCLPPHCARSAQGGPRVLWALALDSRAAAGNADPTCAAICFRPRLMNWSNMICAPLAKSPNCASQRSARWARPASSHTQTQDRIFGQHRVDDFIVRLTLADVVERVIALFGVLIDQARVALAEGAACAS